MTPRSLPEWLALQERQHPNAIDLGLERVRAVAERLELLPWRAASIIVGGTNGKGSTATLIAELASRSGIRAGLFTSPHLRRYEERITIDAMPVDALNLLAAFEAIEAVRGAVSLTFFEWNTLAALWILRAQKVELAVLEVGLGGRLDATNVVDADVAVLTSVGIDHTEWLGPDRESIGREKAGIFRAARPAILATPDMPASVHDVARRIGTRLVVAGADYGHDVARDGQWGYRGPSASRSALPMPGIVGPRQLANAAAALCALESLGMLPTRDQIAAALPCVRLAGRQQMVAGTPPWLLDVAHNIEAATVLAERLASERAYGRKFALLAMLSDKDVAGVVNALRAQVDAWVVAGIKDSPRGLSAADLRARLPENISVLGVADDVVQGCALLRAASRSGDLLVVCGSFHTVGPALDWLGL